MIRFQFFPRSMGITKPIADTIDCFKRIGDLIQSENETLKSNDVLGLVRPYLEQIGYKVEQGKKAENKIVIPVLFGMNNTVDKSFFADALSADGKIVIEIEAGRATENNQYLKDIFQACMMFEVEYLVLVVRNVYRGHKDYDIIHTSLETLYISGRLKLPLKGILLIGY